MKLSEVEGARALAPPIAGDATDRWKNWYEVRTTDNTSSFYNEFISLKMSSEA